MSFHYYSCRYLPPLPSTHVCLPRGLQWRLDKNSPKKTIPSFNEVKTIVSIFTRFVECPKNSMLELLLSSWGRSGQTKFLQAIWSIRMGRPIAIRTTIILLQIFQMIQMSQALMLYVMRIFPNVCFQKNDKWYQISKYDDKRWSVRWWHILVIREQSFSCKWGPSMGRVGCLCTPWLIKKTKSQSLLETKAT